MAKEIEDRFLVEAAAIPTDAVNLNLGRDVPTDCFPVSGVMRLILNLMLRSAYVVSRSNYEKITQIKSYEVILLLKFRVSASQFLKRLAIKNCSVKFLKGI